MESKKIIVTGIFFLFTWSVVLGQQKTTNQNLIWYGYFLTVQLNEKLYFQNEIQERHYIGPTAQHQFLVRSHLHKTFGNSGWESSFGACVFLQNPNNPNAIVKLTVPELRPHIEFGYQQKLTHVSIDHRYRAEARFFHNTNEEITELEDGIDFRNFRFRYKLQATIPIWKINEQKAIKIKVSDEIHLNAVNKIVKNVYDQNRIYAGISLDILTNLTFDIGYLNWFQQRPTGDFYNRNILRFTLYHKVGKLKKG